MSLLEFGIAFAYIVAEFLQVNDNKLSCKSALTENLK